MKIQKIVGEHGTMPQLCARGSCPTAILAENGDVFLQGYLPAADEIAVLGQPDGEAFVRMPRATFEKLARQVLMS